MTWLQVGLLMRVHGFATWPQDGPPTVRRPIIWGAAKKKATKSRPDLRLGARAR